MWTTSCEAVCSNRMCCGWVPMDVLWLGTYGSKEVELVGGERKREQHVPFSKEVESRGEIAGYMTGRLGRSITAVFIHYHLH